MIYHPFRRERILLKKSLLSVNKRDFFMVPLTGIEPVRFLRRGILSPLCLPVPPQRRGLFNYKYDH